MLSMLRKALVAGLLFVSTAGLALADEALKPFILAYTTSGDMNAAAAEVKQKLTGAGFQIVGEYSPYAGALVIAFTNDALKKAAASTDDGGYVAGQRVSLTKVGDQIQVAYTNPIYYGNAYRIADMNDIQAAAKQLEAALGKQLEYGTGDKKLSAKDLRKYHYMFGMEYFDDPSELASYDSYEEAVAAVEEGLKNARGGVTKVYRIDIPGRKETVFGVAMKEGCSGDEYIMSRIDKGKYRHTAHLPYEILVSGGDVYALYARFRIAIDWPHLPMIQSATGATFFSIMCAPNAIEEALTKAAGGDI